MGRVAVALIVSSWVIPISILVNYIVPDPYMDEIFHIPQAQQYCKGNFRSWDPMITTPPGLYFISLAQIAALFPGLLSLQMSFSSACSTPLLRSTNGLLAVICSIMIYEIFKRSRPGLEDRKATFYTVVLSLYPLHWFFTFLYYTDVASLTAVLAMYLMCLKKNYLLSATFGSMAVLIRQTNIIWLLFVACNEVINHDPACSKDGMLLDESSISESKSPQFASNKGVTMSSTLRKRRVSNDVKVHNQSVSETAVSSIHASGFIDEILYIIAISWRDKWDLLASLSPFFIILVAFVAFVAWNGSIVLGAKEAHAVSPHFAQVLYFGLVSSIFMGPVHFSFRQIADTVQLCWTKKLLCLFRWFLALSASFLSVHFFSIAHPYLLADNRHYTFYLWRKIIQFHRFMKYFLVPLYVYSWFSICNILAKRQKKVWVVAYFLASAATLVPAPLIEFRYYTIPFYFLVLHSHVNDDRSWLLMGTFFVAVNVFTMFMFLFRPFSWAHEAGTQRFIW